MILNTKKIATLIFVVIFNFSAMEGFSQQGNNKVTTDKKQLDQLKSTVVAQIDSLQCHEAYIKAMGLENPELEKQYEDWMSLYPKSAMVPYALAKAYLDRENPKAKAYLLKAVSINPGFTEAWGGLWQDGERWGDFEQSRKYLAEATRSDMSNPDYAFYYASSFSEVDKIKWREMSLDVARRFPNHERGAQALYWLAVRSKNIDDKIKYFELLENSFAPAKFSWSSSGLFNYFNLLLTVAPKKALAIAKKASEQEAGERRRWPELVLQATSITSARELLDQKKGPEALVVLNNMKLPKYTNFHADLALMKAEANKLSGNIIAAYDSLLIAFAKAPEVKLKRMVDQYGAGLGKNALQIETDIWKQLDARAILATPFSGLKRYLAPGKASLSDYLGKTVLLTYWFPGCGPCRGEFPHFEKVVKKFRGKDLAYLAINIVSDQNDYVVPFVKSSGYSFTPLEEVNGREKGNLDNRGIAPKNFLIDGRGRLIFSNFRTDGDNEEDLELMLEILLKRKV